MDKNTLNGFEVFEEFMPGGVVNKIHLIPVSKMILMELVKS